MHWGTWVLLGVVAAGILGGFGHLFYRWLKTRVPWKRLSSSWPDVRYHGVNHEPNGQLIAMCLVKTIELMGAYMTWPTAAVRNALGDAHFYIRETDTWVDEWSRWVAGAQSGHFIHLGRNLAAFFHECAHRCEDVIEGKVDGGHVGWAGNGLRGAEAEFEVWLSAQRLAMGGGA